MNVMAPVWISWYCGTVGGHPPHHSLSVKIEIPAATCPSPFQIDALSEVVAAVKGKIEVYLDGGVRTGTDVLKALALGAKCIFLGRPILWGLAYKVRVAK